MPGDAEVDFVEPDEILFRRIPVSQSWYQPPPEDFLNKNAFKPHRTQDTDGLSISRACSDRHPEFLTAEQFGSQGRSSNGYFVVLMKSLLIPSLTMLTFRAIRAMQFFLNCDPAIETRTK